MKETRGPKVSKMVLYVLNLLLWNHWATIGSKLGRNFHWMVL